MDDLAGYVSDDELAIPPLADLGWRVDTVSWRDRSANWDDFEAVVIRTTWDYQDSPREFLDVLSEIDASRARLENPLPIVEWNLDKRYLRDLAARGVPVVPTVWCEESPDAGMFENWRGAFATDEIVIKPTVSATAQDTFRLKEFDRELTRVFPIGRSYMVQPFQKAIVAEGEYSLFFFNGVHSHTILKSPERGDYRVQEEHGGLITAVEAEPALVHAASRVAETIGPVPLYSRIDLVRGEREWLLMELELIEPALYFRMDARSPRLFAEQFHRRMNEL
jgi:glutathione synthase/RimK-type ligase-like ATP-grasp enzyme